MTNNIAIGYNALKSVTTGNRNYAIGYDALSYMRKIILIDQKVIRISDESYKEYIDTFNPPEWDTYEEYLDKKMVLEL